MLLSLLILLAQSVSFLNEHTESSKTILLEEINSHVIILIVRQLFYMTIELFKGVQWQVRYQLLHDRKSCPDDVLMLLSGAAPYSLDNLVLKWALLVLCPHIDELERALDQFTVRVLYIDVLQDLSLLNPLREGAVVEEAADRDVILNNLVVGVALSILDFDENIFKLGHSSYLFVEKGAHEELLSDSQLLRLRHHVDICLRLVNLDESF